MKADGQDRHEQSDGELLSQLMLEQWRLEALLREGSDAPAEEISAELKLVRLDMLQLVARMLDPKAMGVKE